MRTITIKTVTNETFTARVDKADLFIGENTISVKTRTGKITFILNNVVSYEIVE